jgi:hypothetical protein
MTREIETALEEFFLLMDTRLTDEDLDRYEAEYKNGNLEKVMAKAEHEEER